MTDSNNPKKNRDESELFENGQFKDTVIQTVMDNMTVQDFKKLLDILVSDNPNAGKYFWDFFYELLDRPT